MAEGNPEELQLNESRVGTLLCKIQLLVSIDDSISTVDVLSQLVISTIFTQLFQSMYGEHQMPKEEARSLLLSVFDASHSIDAGTIDFAFEKAWTIADVD